MTTQKKKKSAKQKRVLIGSVVVAVAIVAGSTFAWFSSKDEVTNRLTASADYNVSIVEDFQPPADWLPGQTINKDVSAVNTGSVDAFVRMWLGGSMRIVKEDDDQHGLGDRNALNTDIVSKFRNLSDSNVKVTDESLTKLGLNYYDGTRYYKTLSTKKIDNPKDSAHATAADEETNAPAAFSEVQSMQAGGVLVYAPNNAGYHWTLEQAAEMFVDVAANTPPSTLVSIPKDSVVGSPNSTVATSYKLTKTDNASNNYYGEIDASTFQPESTGLYLFRRNVSETASGTENKYEYSGYFYDKDIDGGTYFALYTDKGANQHSDYVLPAGYVTDNSSAVPTSDQVLPVTVKKAYLFTASETLKQTNDLNWTYTDGQKFTVTDNAGISIDIALTNIGAGAEEWTAMKYDAAPQQTTFYYNNDVEAGDTTRKLIDSVKLSENTQVGAYLAFDFDLNVFLDSVQVTIDDTGAEGATTVSPWKTVDLINDTDVNHPIIGASGTPTVQNGEITQISWA
ncbi:MAG: BsaA family SipW-dependent biofilm matrix protein [Eubacteriales bacterium]|nr:BsaA family SipW-dependent biofilm matrix protein [Eubacteriales bacterium]